MELSELIETTKKIFGINEINEIKKALIDTLKDNDIGRMEMFEEMIGVEQDSFRNIFQYYMADRSGKKQDFTPDSLCKLVKELANDDSCYDMCAGTGALSIKYDEVIAYEFDETVIPFLLFNYTIRNIKAEVWHMDVLTGEKYHVYKISKGEKYGYINFESAV